MMEENTETRFGLLYSSIMMLLFLYGALMFLLGFFPITTSPIGMGDNTTNDKSYILKLDNYSLNAPPPAYGQIIFMLIDAFRYDFPSLEGMPFTHSAGCGKLKLHVNIPTVTMPRIKSLVTGTISGFIDIIRNLGHEDQLQESLLHDLQRKGFKIAFAGDRTWLNLFPDVFERASPNVDSFFVNDFYEGDVNVTRVLNSELAHADWHLLILHYLGLDHIGHVEGSESAKIGPKLREMDTVLRNIYETTHFDRQLILLTGDHGMRNGGGHGGSTREEMSVPLIYFNSNCRNTPQHDPQEVTYNQIDLAATLAQLMAVPTPRTSIGCLIPELLTVFDYPDQLFVFLANTQHLVNKAVQTFGLAQASSEDYFKRFGSAKLSHQAFVKHKHDYNKTSLVLFEQTKREYMRISVEISGLLSASLVNFDYEFIIMGLFLVGTMTWNSCLKVISQSHSNTRKHTSEHVAQLTASVVVAVIIYCALLFTQFLQFHTLTKSVAMLFGLTATTYIVTEIRISMNNLHACRTRISLKSFPIACYSFYIFSLASSSFIEYEQELWYYLGTTNILLLVGMRFIAIVHGKKLTIANVAHVLWDIRYGLLALLSSGLLRKIAQYSLFQCRSEQTQLATIMFGIGLAMLLMRLIIVDKLCLKVAIFSAIFSIYCHHMLSAGTNTYKFIPLLCFWSSLSAVAVLGIYCVFYSRLHRKNVRNGAIETVYVCSLLLCALLQKPSNVILLAIMLNILDQTYNLIEHTTAQYKTNKEVIVEKTLITIFVGRMFYFCQGNSNSLATVDLNPGYIGQSSYHAATVFILVTMNTFCSPNNSFFHLVLHLLKEHPQHPLSLEERQKSVVLSLHVGALAVLMPAAIYKWLLLVLRYHLFIFSVFSPKVLYEFFNVAVFFFIFLISSVCLQLL